MTVSREQTLSRIAAMLAISNYGLGMHIDDWVGRPDSWADNPENEVENAGGHFMESDEHEEMFRGEARSWYDQIENLSFGEIRDTYHWNKWIGEIIEAADPPPPKVITDPKDVPLQFRLLSDAAVAGRKDIGPLSD